MSVQTEDVISPTLKGMPGVSMSEPKARSAKGMLTGDGSVGDAAFRDGVILVLVAWALLFFLAYSLRRHII
ncbi:MAG TPA: hypothetical protein VJ553_02035 [Candidatus Paceibacterota bacterium]|nr:hypothetical protein [Candidatus Paceibacterota bacterium]